VHDAVALAGGPDAAVLTLVTGSGSVHASDDGGLAWTPVGTVTAHDVVDAVLLPDAELVLLTRSGSVLSSTNGGATFVPVGVIAASNFVSLARHSSSLVALTRTGEVVRSTNGGGDWIGTGSFPVSDAVAVRGLGNVLVAMTGTGDVYRSPDEGQSWTAVGTLSQVGMTALVIDGGDLVAVSREGHTAASSDGTTWTWRGSIGQLHVTALGTDAPATGVEALPLPGGPFALSAPWPNPSRGGESAFRFRVDRPSTLTFELFDVSGRRVARRPPESLVSAGEYTIRWNPGRLPSGIYALRVADDAGRTDGRRWTILR
jgi:hypothetical protein